LSSITLEFELKLFSLLFAVFHSISMNAVGYFDLNLTLPFDSASAALYKNSVNVSSVNAMVSVIILIVVC
jgi:hypothetical protein